MLKEGYLYFIQISLHHFLNYYGCHYSINCNKTVKQVYSTFVLQLYVDIPENVHIPPHLAVVVQVQTMEDHDLVVRERGLRGRLVHTWTKLID